MAAAAFDTVASTPATVVGVLVSAARVLLVARRYGAGADVLTAAEDVVREIGTRLPLSHFSETGGSYFRT